MVMSYLPARHIVNLRYASREMDEFVSSHETYISEPRIQHELSRISWDFNDIDFTADEPIEFALRRWCRTYRYGHHDSKFEYCVRHFINSTSAAFATTYSTQNPRRITNIIEFMSFVQFALEVDYWLQRRKFAPTMESIAPSHMRNLERALVYATMTPPSATQGRCDQVIALGARWISPEMRLQLSLLFDSIERNPLLKRSEWPTDGDLRQVQAPPARGLFTSQLSYRD